MAGTGGYFLQGLAGGIQTGYNMRMNKMEMDWKKKEREALEKKQNEFIEVSKNVQGMITKFGEDGTYSSDEILQLNTAIMAGGIEIQQQFKDWMKSIQDGDREKVSQQKGYIDSWLNEIDGFTPENIDSVFNSVSQYVTHPEAKKYLDASMAIKKKKAEYADPNVKAWERAGTLPMESRPEYLRAQGIDVPQPTTAPKEPTALSAKDNWAIENYNTGKISFDQLSKYMGTLIEPEKATELQKKIAEAKNYGASNEEIKKMIVGGTGGGEGTPEGEITAGEKRSWDMASSIMFGSSDVVTGISKPGIIPTRINNRLNMGQPLTPEEQAEIRNNYNAIKNTLPGAIKNLIESQLIRYGISLEEPAPVPEPTPTPEPEKQGFNLLKPKTWFSGGKEETPTQEQKDYSTMSEDELKQAVMAGDPQAIEEAKKRGYIK